MSPWCPIRDGVGCPFYIPKEIIPFISHIRDAVMRLPQKSVSKHRKNLFRNTAKVFIEIAQISPFVLTTLKFLGIIISKVGDL